MSNPIKPMSAAEMANLKAAITPDHIAKRYYAKSVLLLIARCEALQEAAEWLRHANWKDVQHRAGCPEYRGNRPWVHADPYICDCGGEDRIKQIEAVLNA